MNVIYLECSLTGERYEPGQVHNLSRAGKPLIVRYDTDAAKRTLTRRQHRDPGSRDVEMARVAARTTETQSASASLKRRSSRFRRRRNVKVRPRCW